MRVHSRVLLLVVSLLLASSPLNAVPVCQWSKQFAVNSSLPDRTLVVIDGSGNTILAGNSNAAVGTNFGGGLLIRGAFIAKFDLNGNHIWSKSFFGGAGISSVAVDGSGNIVITGGLFGFVDFGGGLLSSPAGGNIILASFGADGSHRWSQQFGDDAPQGGYSVAMDASGNVAITGEMYGSVNFGGADLNDVGAPYTPDVFIARFDTNGNHLWSKRFGDVEKQIGWSIDVDGSGNSILTGEYTGSFSFGGASLPSTNFPNVFVAKFGPGGNYIWSHGSGQFGSSQGLSIATDGTGGVVIEGTGTVDFGGGAVSGGLFLAKLDSGGNHLWSKAFSGYWDSAFPPSCAVNAAGTIALTGQTGGGTDFGGGQLAGGHGNAYLAVFDPDGNHYWSQSFGDTVTLDAGRSVAVDPFGNLVITGLFVKSIDFGGGPLTTPLGQRDIFLARFTHDSLLPVLITRFEATPRNAAVEIRWDVWSDEDLESFTLFRRSDLAIAPIVIAQGVFNAGARSYLDTSVEPGKTYHYELLIRTSAGDELRSPVATATAPTLIASLGQNHPNPFNPRTTIEYTLSEPSRAILEIYNAAGALVTALDQGMQRMGAHHAEWDGRDAQGRPVSTGVYFYRLDGVPGVSAKKMVLLK